jgi:hypothetical protein
VRVGRVHVAFDEVELLAKLERVDSIRAGERISPHASAQLIGVIREFITSRGVAGGFAGGVGQRQDRPEFASGLDGAFAGEGSRR